MKGKKVWSGSKEHQRCGMFGPSLPGGTELRLPHSFSLLQGKKRPTSSTGSSVLVVGRKGKRVHAHEPCPGPRATSPGWAQSFRRPGGWCEVKCLLCQGHPVGCPVWPQNCGPWPCQPTLPSALSMLAHAQTHGHRRRHHKLNKMNGYMLQF